MPSNANTYFVLHALIRIDNIIWTSILLLRPKAWSLGWYKLEESLRVQSSGLRALGFNHKWLHSFSSKNKTVMCSQMYPWRTVILHRHKQTLEIVQYWLQNDCVHSSMSNVKCGHLLMLSHFSSNLCEESTFGMVPHNQGEPGLKRDWYCWFLAIVGFCLIGKFHTHLLLLFLLCFTTGRTLYQRLLVKKNNKNNSIM